MHLSTKACATSSFVTRSVGRNLFQAAAALDRASASRRWLHPEDVSGGASVTVAMVLTVTPSHPIRCSQRILRLVKSRTLSVPTVAPAHIEVCWSALQRVQAINNRVRRTISGLLATAILAVAISFVRPLANKPSSTCLHITVCCPP